MSSIYLLSKWELNDPGEYPVKGFVLEAMAERFKAECEASEKDPSIYYDITEIDVCNDGAARDQELESVIKDLLIYICRVDGADPEHKSVKAAINAIEKGEKE
jgi:hypothetical protein